MDKPGFSADSQNAPIRVLVVDDSAFMRLTITRYLNETPGIQVVGSARDGQETLELIPRYQPDVITLDVEMPRMDGLATLRAIMNDFPRPVIMLSSLTTEGATETIQALTLGAVDFVAKPANKANIATVMEEVIDKIRRAAGAKIGKNIVQRPALNLDRANLANKTARSVLRNDRIVVIGSSTGGP